ncbi:MAG: YihY/virulence factor BrkB family protein [Firmicutes bacterium]|nr:YihY/virulence factor BrkB family protein [Bacillota bacterium]
MRHFSDMKTILPEPWIDVAKNMAARVARNDLSSYAAALAYNFLFAIFPLMLFLTALLGFLHLPDLQQVLTGPVTTIVPRPVLKLIFTTIEGIVNHKSPALLSVGGIGFLWAMSGAFRQMIDAMNHAYEFPFPWRRKYWQSYLLSLGLGLGIGIILLLLVIITVSGVHLLQWALFWMTGIHIVRWMVLVVRWVVVLIGFLSVMAILYAVLPDRPQVFTLWSWGGLFAVAVFVLISLGFSYYASHFSDYNHLYGSLGAVIILMLYLYLFGWAMLLGAEINAWQSSTTVRRR